MFNLQLDEKRQNYSLNLSRFDIRIIMVLITGYYGLNYHV